MVNAPVIIDLYSILPAPSGSGGALEGQDVRGGKVMGKVWVLPSVRLL
jgi:hypothetical protein